MTLEHAEIKTDKASAGQDAVVTAAIAVYDPIEAGLTELKTRLAGKVYPDITTTAGYKEHCADRTELVKVRTSTEKLRKAAKAPYVEAGKKIDEIAKRITAEAEALESPIQALIDAEDARKEAIKAEKAAAEALRIDGIRKKISAFTQFIIMAANFDSAALTEHIAKIQAGHLAAIDYAELLPEAETAKLDVLVKLKEQLAALLEREAEDKRIEDERVENERQAVHQRAVDAITRLPFTAAQSGYGLEQLKELQADIEQTDISRMEEYQDAAAQAKTAAVASISVMIQQIEAAEKLKRDQEKLDADREEQRLKDEAAEKERARIENIRGMIARIKGWPLKCIGLASVYIREEIAGSEMDIPCTVDDYAELTAEAEAERIIALSTMTNMAEAAEKSEAEAKRLDDQRREQEAAQKVLDDAKRATEEQEAADQAEREAALIAEAPAESAAPEVQSKVLVADVAGSGAPCFAEDFMVKIEKYGFECEGGSLVNCKDWLELKTIVAELRADSNLLNALRAGGVDNWEHFDDVCAQIDAVR